MQHQRKEYLTQLILLVLQIVRLTFNNFKLSGRKFENSEEKPTLITPHRNIRPKSFVNLFQTEFRDKLSIMSSTIFKKNKSNKFRRRRWKKKSLGCFPFFCFS